VAGSFPIRSSALSVPCIADQCCQQAKAKHADERWKPIGGLNDIDLRRCFTPATTPRRLARRSRDFTRCETAWDAPRRMPAPLHARNLSEPLCRIATTFKSSSSTCLLICRPRVEAFSFTSSFFGGHFHFAADRREPRRSPISCQTPVRQPHDAESYCIPVARHDPTRRAALDQQSMPGGCPGLPTNGRRKLAWKCRDVAILVAVFFRRRVALPQFLRATNSASKSSATDACMCVTLDLAPHFRSGARDV